MADRPGQDGGGQGDTGCGQQEEWKACGASGDPSGPTQAGHKAGRLPGHHQTPHSQAPAGHHVLQLVHHGLHHVRPRSLLAESHRRPLPQLHHRNHPGLPCQDPGHGADPEGGEEVSVHVRLHHDGSHVPPDSLHRT